MGKGKKMAGGSFMSKHAKNLLNYMPIDDRAGSGSDSDLNYNGTPLHHDKQYQHTHEGAWDKVKNTVKDNVDYRESGNNRYAFKGKMKWKSDDWSAGYSGVQKQFKKVAPKLSGRND